jgi:hypothetical protein
MTTQPATIRPLFVTLTMVAIAVGLGGCQFPHEESAS